MDDEFGPDAESWPDDGYLEALSRTEPEDHPLEDPTPQSPRPGLTQQVVETLITVLACQHGRPAGELAGVLSQVRASTRVLDCLSDETRLTVLGALEVLEFEVANLTEDAEIDLFDLPALKGHATSVQRLIGAVRGRVAPGLPTNPVGHWLALADEVQKLRARTKLQAVIEAIDAKAPTEHTMELWRATEAPGIRVAVVRDRGLRTAARMLEEHEASRTGTASLAFSCGSPSLDLALSKPGESVGGLRPGENTLYLGATGTGKSTKSYGEIQAQAQDLRNWGLDEGLLVLFHTEEESHAKARSIGLHPGQRFSHLANNIVIENIGSSLQRITEMIYDIVAHAAIRSQETGRTARDFMAQIVHVDYVQAIRANAKLDPVTDQVNVAEFILRGLQACNPEEMEKYSGVNFTAHTGMPWPDDLEHHRIAVVTYGQLRKKSGGDADMYFRSSNKRQSLGNFTLEDTSGDPAWTDPTGNAWCWEVREGDFMLFTKDDMLGSTKSIQNATNVILLHRSNPRPQSTWKDGTGQPHLEDSRARLILDKTRNGSQVRFIPMAFDVAPLGLAGARYYDVVAEKRIREGLLRPHEVYEFPGDPILPIRPARSPLAGLKY